MVKQFMPELSPKERTIALQEHASKIDQTTYQKPLSADELALRREDFVDNCEKLGKFEDELKAIKDDYKLKTEPLTRINKILLGEIKTRQTTVDGILYRLANQDEGMMETYDADGFLVETRRLRPEEKQARLFVAGKTGTAE